MLANSRGLGTERETLQQLGEGLVDSDLEHFCREVLSSANWHPGQGIVLDGIRHAETLEMLGRIAAPLRVILIHMDVPEPIRAERLKTRGVPEDDARRQEEHSTERQVVAKLPDIADLRIDGTHSPESLKDAVITWLRNQLPIH